MIEVSVRRSSRKPVLTVIALERTGFVFRTFMMLILHDAD
jgi:hypothetical protein